MASRSDFDITGAQRDAWIEQARILRGALHGRSGAIYLEFTIPRIGSRVDALLLIGPVLFVVEFKVGETRFTRQDLDQVVDYALDLHHFHEGSHQICIAPVLVSTQARGGPVLPDERPVDGLFAPSRTNSHGLAAALDRVLEIVSGPEIAVPKWEESGYKPTPTIIEATLALYRGHSVADITRKEAGVENLSATSNTVAEIIASARSRSEKAVCFVTGVPGAGKTLVGLDAATRHMNARDELYSVFLSGNGPLVNVLQEALTRDRVERARRAGLRARKGEARSEVKAFIQNVHHFRDDCIRDPKPPVEHVAIFDEAQRAWTLKETVDFMRRKKGMPDFHQSEPEFLLSCMDRHPDWAVVICLVGGGQEINRGEAGISEWFAALERSFPAWWIYASDRLTDSEYEGGRAVERLRAIPRVAFKSDLHLATSIRSFRSEKVSRFVKEVLDLERENARETLRAVTERYPVVLTRDLEVARRWLRAKARGTERYGIVVSSQAERLKPYALDVKSPVDPVHWFLSDKDDVRSSYYLEDVATEFHIQGLELDWTCVVWDADLRHSASGWEHWSFRGNRWERMRSEERRSYQKNAYRVLLTRARQGMIIVVPRGDAEDPTRRPQFYDPTFAYLKGAGLSVL
ncbi:MAG: DUF2075 domain-containing protein [Planctomycetes bacterium]|nr:DUF2075 domain-containing protein [Planctomycetota bacterium]